tara:strand:+ start:315 stop:677 length:363 start_codon:yes stop_codon:yes gene_type:complete
MVFFAICIAPVVNNSLDRSNSSKLLRKLFPRNFTYGLILSFIALILSITDKNFFSIIIAIIIIVSFSINLKVLIPMINSEADKFINNNKYSNRFKKLHFISVTLYLLNIIMSSVAIIKNY